MKRTKSYKECDFKIIIVRGRHIIPISLVPFPQCLPQQDILNHTFKRPLTCQEQTSLSFLYKSKINGCRCQLLTKHGIVTECANQPVLYCIVLYCIALHCIALHCIVLNEVHDLSAHVKFPNVHFQLPLLILSKISVEIQFVY